MVKILAIDDNNDNLISVKAMIRDAFPDTVVFTALNGHEGIQLALLEIPDVILLDVVMPGMDGFEVCHLCKEETSLKHIPVIFLTAIKETRENRIRALEAGAEGFLTKPIDETELIAQVRAMFKINQANKEKIHENERLNVLVEERTAELRNSQMETLQLLEELKEEIEVRKKTESALRESEQRWSTTLASIGDAVIATDTSGLITFMNNEAEKLTGWTRKEAIFNSTAKIFRIIDEKAGLPVEDSFAKIIEQGIKKTNSQNNILISRYGKQIAIDYCSAPIRSFDNNITGVVLIFRDITEHKLAEDILKKHGLFLEEEVRNRTAELEDAKIRAESADKLKSAFLANLSHELRTPLNSIIGFSGVLLQGFPGPLNQEQIKQLTMIQSSGRHLLSLINDILDLSKIESGQMSVNYELFNVHELLDEILRLQRPIAYKKGLSLNLSITPEAGEIESDPQRVKQIILNLVNNAIKFTEKGTIDITCNRQDHFISITVADTGPGIKQEDLGKLFKPFVQIEEDFIRKNEGSGLGLSICKRLTELLKGDIYVKSEYGIGSSFTVKIPSKI